MKLASRLVCGGCGAAPNDPLVFACPNAGRGDGVDHVLRRVLDLDAVGFPAEAGVRNPFVRYRSLLHPYHLGRSHGLSDEELAGLISELDARVAAVDGHGFAATPFGRSDALSDALGFLSLIHI